MMLLTLLFLPLTYPPNPPQLSLFLFLQINHLFCFTTRHVVHGTNVWKGFPLGATTNQMMWTHHQLHKNDQHLLHPSAAPFCLGIGHAILHAPLRQLNYSVSHVCMCILESQKSLTLTCCCSFSLFVIQHQLLQLLLLLSLCLLLGASAHSQNRIRRDLHDLGLHSV